MKLPVFPTHRGRRAALVLATLCGIALGVGAFTAQYDAWQKASHHDVATCADCHIPATGLAKWIAKAENGYHHSRGFTFQDFHEPIRISAKNADILQANCVRCHADLLHDQLAGATTARNAIHCVHCHHDVGHGASAGLGGADRESPASPQPESK